MADCKTFFDSIIQTISENPGCQVSTGDGPGYFGWVLAWTTKKGANRTSTRHIDISQVRTPTGSMDLFMLATLETDRDFFNKSLLRAGQIRGSHGSI